eukprot:gene21597-27635_t
MLTSVAALVRSVKDNPFFRLLIVPKSVESFTPRIFGFRIHETSQYYKLREPHQLKRKPSKSSNNANGTKDQSASPVVVNKATSVNKDSKTNVLELDATNSTVVA